MTNKLCVLVAIAAIGMGCGTSNDSGTGGEAGSGGEAGNGGTAGAGGEAGAGGTAAKCETAQDILRCSVVNIAHRGGRRIRPEHTLLAYDKALEDGTDILELDVHETSDGELVIMHDDTLNRTTDCTGPIKDTTFAAIRMCDAGYNFSTDGGATYPYRGTGLVVPTLQEALVRYPDTAFVIEVKQEEPSIVDHFVEVLEEYEAVDKTVGSAFSDAVLVELREAAPALATSIGVDETREFWLQSQIMPPDPSYEPPAEFLQIPLSFGGIDLLHPNLIPFAHGLGMTVHFWTINDEADMRMLIVDYGVDGIMTDDPPLLTAVITDLDAAPAD